MPIVVDTSALTAYLNGADERHSRSMELMRRVMKGELGVPVAPSEILTEGLTLLRKRPGRRDVSDRFSAMFTPTQGLDPVIRLIHTTPEELRAAVRLHFQRYAERLSVADCVLLGLAAAMSAPILSFDEGFDGHVERIH